MADKVNYEKEARELFPIVEQGGVVKLKCKWRLWSGVWKGTNDICPNIWLNKNTARHNLGPHMRVIEVKIVPGGHTVNDKKVNKYLKDLVKAVTIFLGSLDAEMIQPSTLERGKNIAKISNYLEMEKDRARHFGLGEKL